jgi:hypothetical protein
MVLNGDCPWCERTGFAKLAQHTAMVHDVDRRSLREMAGLPWSAIIASPEVTAERREFNASPEQVERLRALGHSRRGQSIRGREVSPAARAIWAASARSITVKVPGPKKLTEEQRAMVRAAVDAATPAARPQLRRDLAAQLGVSEATIRRTAERVVRRVGHEVRGAASD